VPVLLRQFLHGLIKEGSLEVFPSSARPFAVGDGGKPSCAIQFTDRSAEVALALDPEMAVGELYVDGRLKMVRGEIYDLLALGASNLAGGKIGRVAAWQRLRQAVAQLRRGIHPGRARANVAHHYDLDGRLYQIFLDRDQQYSCAYFESPGLGLEAAQTAKKRHVAAKLAIEPGHRILDIGCGWGGLALYLARFCGAEVLGVTLSTEQLDAAQKKAGRAGLAAKVHFDLRDYRHVQGRFDRIVSVGMFEHVGPKHYDAFFARIAELLREDGVALVHTIGHFAGPAPTNPWVRKYIFPDGHLPALAEIAPAIARAGLMIADVETLREHYALTLAHWRARFAAGREEARSIYGERFCRMWEFYLAAAECGFRFHGCCVLQIQLIKRLDALPITRDYVLQREAALRARENLQDGLTDAAE
jgi:cyclopropane-fatty-acyl-phospholipid synthase